MDIRSPTAALLPVLAFAGATKRNRPRLVVGDTVYARIAETSRDQEPELTCIDAQGRAATALGQLECGYVLETDTAHARKLLAYPPAPELVALGESLAFEISVGANGRILINSQAPRVTAVVAQALRATARLGKDEARIRVLEIVSSGDRMQA